MTGSLFSDAFTLSRALAPGTAANSLRLAPVSLRVILDTLEQIGHRMNLTFVDPSPNRFIVVEVADKTSCRILDRAVQHVPICSSTSWTNGLSVH